MSAAFSSNEVDVLSRETDVPEDTLLPASSESLEKIYEIERCVDYIKENAYSQVALQFPDCLLPDAAKVTRELQNRTSACVYLLADTSYGSYDVDEVAGQHVQADVIIHYGKAAVTASATIPTLYVFGGRETNVQNIYDAFVDKFPNIDEKVCVLADVAYIHALGVIDEKLKSEYLQIAVANLQLPEQPAAQIKGDFKEDFCTNSCPDCSCRTSGNSNKTSSDNYNSSIHQFEAFRMKLAADSSIDDYSLFFIGSSDAEMLRNYLLLHPTCKGHAFDPRTGRCQAIPTTINKLLMKRYYVMEKVKDAGTAGILVGTMGMAGFRDVIKHLKNILKQSGKKSYTFVVGKLNPAKLANFPEIDVFVLVACPEESLIDASSYYKPIATPYEVEIACNANREWGESYVTDFTELLPGGKHHVEFRPSIEPDVSLVTGKLRDATTIDANGASAGDNQLDTVKDKTIGMFHPYSSAQFYADRSWKGLEQKVGETPVGGVKEGRTGIPMVYRNEV